MANNPANDRYNPPSASQPDFEPAKFNDLPTGEIFYLEERGDPYRKVSDDEAVNTRHQTTHEVLSNIDIFTRI